MARKSADRPPGAHPNDIQAQVGHASNQTTLHQYGLLPKYDEAVHDPIDYLDPRLPPGLAWVPMPVVDATPASLEGYGCLVDDPAQCRIEIVRWPSSGTRPVDSGTGNQGGTTEGVFISEWRGDVLYGRNEAVGGHYILAYALTPESAREDHTDEPRRILLWHANYHPDGGQLFFPLQHEPFYVPLALPGDDVTPQKFVCFRFSGHQGLYIPPNVWHEGVLGSGGTQRFFDRQGAVHARVSVDFPREFGCLLEAPISR
jgi:Ureidoglycolate lyase